MQKSVVFAAFLVPRVSKIRENTAYMTMFRGRQNATISFVVTCNNNNNNNTKNKNKNKNKNKKEKKKKKNNSHPRAEGIAGVRSPTIISYE